MGRLESLVETYARHIDTPWQRTVSGAQRVVMVVYDKDLERTLRARKMEFETVTIQARHFWNEIDLTGAFAAWLASDDYSEAYFEAPEDLELKLNAEFTEFVANRIREALTHAEVDSNTVVAVFGVGSLFGLCSMAQVLKLVERDIVGRLVIFFPGHHDKNNFRLLDAKDGWNYLAVPITHHSSESPA